MNCVLGPPLDRAGFPFRDAVQGSQMDRDKATWNEPQGLHLGLDSIGNGRTGSETNSPDIVIDLGKAWIHPGWRRIIMGRVACVLVVKGLPMVVRLKFDVQPLDFGLCSKLPNLILSCRHSMNPRIGLQGFRKEPVGHSPIQSSSWRQQKVLQGSRSMIQPGEKEQALVLGRHPNVKGKGGQSIRRPTTLLKLGRAFDDVVTNFPPSIWIGD